MLKKWLTVIAIPLIFQVVFLIILFVSQSYRTNAQEWAIHTVEVIAKAETIGRTLTEARSFVLSGVLGGKPALASFESTNAEIDRLFVDLEESVKDNGKNLGVVQDTHRRSKRYLEWLEKVNTLAGSGRRDEAERMLNDPSPRVTLRQIRGRLEVFLDAERKLNTQRQKVLARINDVQQSLLIGGAALSVALTIGLAILFSRGFASRIERLAQNAKFLAEGKPLSDPLKGGDEIGQLDAVFRAMARSLADRDQENEMFIYSVSHDLRSPLVNLQGFSKELTYTCDDVRQVLANIEKSPEIEARLKRFLDEDMHASIHFIQNAVSRLSAIIDSLLRLSRAGRVEYRVQEVDVAELMTRVVEALEGSIKERGAEIRVGPLPPTWGDPTIVEQVFANLLSNAVKYLDPSRRGMIEVGAEEGGEGLTTYHVRDNGLGIAKAHQTKLFHAFQRLHPGAAAGEGIGLALARRMVERHGGKIWAESEAGEGSTFFVTLPSHAPVASANGRPQADTNAFGGTR